MAKFCHQCGLELTENDQFCPTCGATIPATDPVPTSSEESFSELEEAFTPAPDSPVKERKSLTPKQKLYLIGGGILAVLLALIATALIVFFTSPAQKIYQKMKSADYDTAVSLYQDKVKGHPIHCAILEHLLDDYDEVIVREFKNGELEYLLTLSGLNALDTMGFDDIEEQILQVNQKRETDLLLAQGDQYVADGYYEDALRAYSSIEEGNDRYGEAQQRLAETYPKYLKALIAQVQKDSDAGHYEPALTVIDEALAALAGKTDLTGLTEAKEQILEKYRAYILEQTKILVESDRYSEAFDLLDEAIKREDHADLRAARAAAEIGYVTQLTAIVETCLSMKDYVGASQAISEGLSLLPENTALQELKDKVSQSTPTYLLDVCKPHSTEMYTPYASGTYFQSGGISYTNGFALGSLGSAAFNLNGAYTSLNFYAGHLDNSGKGDMIIKVYCDGILKTQHTMAADALPKKFNLDITGANQVKFVLEYDTSEAPSSDVYFGFGHITVQ